MKLIKSFQQVKPTTQKPVRYRINSGDEFDVIRWDGDSNLASEFFGPYNKAWVFCDSGMTQIFIMVPSNGSGYLHRVRMGDVVIKSTNGDYCVTSEEFLSSGFFEIVEAQLKLAL